MPHLDELSAHLIARRGHFDWEEFETLVAGPADIKQVWEAFAFRPPVFNNLKNSLNGLTFGYGYDPSHLRLIFAPHGPSNAYNYNDSIWQKYRIGEAMNLRGADGNLVTRNTFVARNPTATSSDLNDERGAYQDLSIERLAERGVIFLTCATALQEQARIVRDAGFAPAGMSASNIARDMLENLIPYARLVPSMVATIAVLQQKYGYAYLTIDF